MFKIKTGDEVVVINGKDKGKKGKVTKIVLTNNIVTKVLVEGINEAKKHVKPNQKMQNGGIVNINIPLDVSNVMLICPSCKKPTKVEITVLKDKKSRSCKKCSEVIDK